MIVKLAVHFVIAVRSANHISSRFLHFSTHLSCAWTTVAAERLERLGVCVMLAASSLKHDGVVLLPVAAPLGRGADGVDAMA